MGQNKLITFLTEKERNDILNICRQDLRISMEQAKSAMEKDMPILLELSRRAQKWQPNENSNTTLLISKLEFKTGEVIFTKPIFLEKIDLQNNNVKEVALNNQEIQSRNRAKEENAIEQAKKQLSQPSEIKRRHYLKIDENGEPVYLDYKINEPTKLSHKFESNRPLNNGSICITFKPELTGMGKERFIVVDFFDESRMGMPTKSISIKKDGQISMEYYTSPMVDYSLSLQCNPLTNNSFDLDGISHILSLIDNNKVTLDSINYKTIGVSYQIKDELQKRVIIKLGLKKPIEKNLNLIINEELNNALIDIVERTKGNEPLQKSIIDEKIRKAVLNEITQMPMTAAIYKDIIKQTRALAAQLSKKNNLKESEVIPCHINTKIQRQIVITTQIYNTYTTAQRSYLILSPRQDYHEKKSNIF